MKLFLLFVLLTIPVVTRAQGSLASDRTVLEKLYQATDGAQWYNNTGWLTPGSSPCSWYGITCSSSGDRVTEINLSDNGLLGALPPELGSLTALKALRIHGRLFPEGDIVLRRYPDEGYINGTLPAELGNLVNLEYMELALNYFTGTIPGSFGNLINLKVLDLHHETMFPDYDPNGALGGSIPASLGNLTKLEKLDLSYLSLTGNLPAELGNLAAIKVINLDNNNFTGSIPSTFTNLSNLISLSVSIAELKPGFNLPRNFGNMHGPLPDLSGIPAACEINIVGQSYNFDGLETNIGHTLYVNPQQILKLNYTSMPIGRFSVDAGGTLANNIYKWYKNSTLVATVAGDNSYVPQAPGTYYVTVTNTALNSLGLVLKSESKAFTGSSIENDRLALIALYNSTNGSGWTNKWTSTMLAGNPCSSGLYGVTCDGGRVTGLNLANNNLVGSLPLEMGNLQALKSLDLNGDEPTEANKTGFISGEIPSTFIYLTNLEILDLHNNQLTGNIPTLIGRLTSVQILNLSFNSLTGTIPNILAIPVSATVDISNNGFTFEGMESNISRLDNYSPQKQIPLISYGPALRTSGEVDGPYVLGGVYVEAGGTLANNTYKWYKDNILVSIKIGDRYAVAAQKGVYRMEVTNSLVSGLTLVTSDYKTDGLPVTLTSFSGFNKSEKNFLTWKTTSETNNAGFEIEKSANAINFEKIGFVDGIGDSKHNETYTFTDENPLPTTYYRLKQIDFDGKFEYSRIISVKKDLSKISVYPNPASDYLVIKGLEKEEKMVVRNLEGKIMLDESVFPKQSIGTGNLPNGFYIITVGDETRKLVIQK